MKCEPTSNKKHIDVFKNCNARFVERGMLKLTVIPFRDNTLFPQEKQAKASDKKTCMPLEIIHGFLERSKLKRVIK